MNLLLDCQSPAQTIKDEVKVQIVEKIKGKSPSLAIIMVGFDLSMQSYIKGKKNDCLYCGIEPIEYFLNKETTTRELGDLIKKLNVDENITGIIVEMPLPKHIDKIKITSLINPAKDVDAINPINIGNLLIGDESLSPCTPKGIAALLSYHNIEVSGKHCVILGRSVTVGKPMALMMLNRDCTVTICHSKTAGLLEKIKQADILISAVGKAEFIKGDMIKKGAIIIDVGINYKDNKLVGDVQIESCYGVASKITPVPKGVGLMTRAILMQNILKVYVEMLKNVDK